MSATLWIGLALSLATAAVYAIVGWRVLPRARGTARGPLEAFALWWFALAFYTFLLAVRDTLAIQDLLDRNLLKTITHLSVGPLVAALWGLFYYLAYIFVGGKRLLWPSVALYSAMYLVFIYITVTLEPAAIILRTWDVRIEYATEIPPLMSLMILALLLVPILLAVLAYASLLFRLEEGEQRLRVGVVSFAFLAWFGGSLLAVLMGLAEVEWWGLGGRLLAMGSAALVAIVYAKPRRRPGGPRQFPATEAEEHG